MWSGPGGRLRKPVAAAEAVTVGCHLLPRLSPDLCWAPDALQHPLAMGCFVLKQVAGYF